jgi:hypothetical protein
MDTTKSSGPNMMAKIMNYKENIASIIIVIAIITIIVLAIVYYHKLSKMDVNECDSMGHIYNKINYSISSVNPSNPDNKYALKDYYIKTAYNACSIGSYKNNFVSTCALKDVLRNGSRGLDFEIYSVDEEPVVSSSTMNSYFVKETFNSVPFKDVMSILVNYAFSSGTVPNPKDPIIIHLRFKTQNMNIYNKMASLFKQYDRFFMGPEYSYEYNGHNFGNVKLLDLMGKIIIIVDNSNTTYQDNEDFSEYVNMASNSIFMRALPYHDIVNTPDLIELQSFNKQNMTISMPDTNLADPSNPNPIVCREAGCNLIGMRYEEQDVNLEENNTFFNQNASAFCLKPTKLRYIPVVIPDPVKQTPKVSFAPRKATGSYYSFNY